LAPGSKLESVSINSQFVDVGSHSRERKLHVTPPSQERAQAPGRTQDGLATGLVEIVPILAVPMLS